MKGLLKSIMLEREAWVQFLLALAGLTLAFAAAVFSTATREAGNLVGTVLLATVALLLAGWVGITTVPRLARRVAAARVREVFDYDFTRTGMVYLALTIVISVAALNTGNNLLFMVVSAMLAAVIVSGVASATVLRELELDVRLPEHVFAQSRAAALITLLNRRLWLPSYSISVVPLRPRTRRRWRWERSVFSFPPKRLRPWFRLPDLSLRIGPVSQPSANLFHGMVYFAYLPPREAQTAELQLQFPRRGRYTQESFGLATRFPFYFLEKTRHVALARELIVYPPIEPTDSTLESLPLITGEFETFVRGRGYDLYRIREHMPEDTARHVDWKATAKTGSLKVREFTREDERKLRIVFDNPAPSVLTEAEYEEAVATAASLAWHFADDGIELSFAAPGFRGDGIYDFLRYLALVGPEAGASVLDTLPVTDDYNLIVTARSQGRVPTKLWTCSYLVFVDHTERTVRPPEART